MTEAEQVRDDLNFIRVAVARRDDARARFTAAYYIWAAYILVGYCLLDINHHWANWFFLLAWFPAGAACGILRHFWVRRNGERNDALNRRFKLHFMAGGLLAIAAVFGLACCVPGFRGPLAGQVCVVFFGIIYFLAGVHFDRSFLWLGPLLIVGGVCVGLVPHYGWSALGVVIAAGLCAAALLGSRRQRSIPLAGE